MDEEYDISIEPKNEIIAQITENNIQVDLKKEDIDIVVIEAVGQPGENGQPGEKGETGMQGIQGEKGDVGVGLNFTWIGFSLGLKREDQAEYVYTNLRGARGPNIIQANVTTTNMVGLFKGDEFGFVQLAEKDVDYITRSFSDSSYVKIDQSIPQTVGSSNNRMTNLFSISINSNNYWIRNYIFGSMSEDGKGLYIGEAARASSGKGIGNIAIGYLALNVFGEYASANIAVGGWSMYKTTSGSKNIAVGLYSLTENISGNDNVAIGYYSLWSNISGAYNIALGNNSMGGCTIGQYNTAIGYYSLINNISGNENIALGSYATRFIRDGIGNVGIGHFSGTHHADNVTELIHAQYSIYIGWNSRGKDNNDNNSIVIGASAIGLGANTVVLGNDSIVITALKGSVGIGTVSPSSKLDVLGTARFGDHTTNYTEFEADGTMIARGDAVCYNDIYTAVAAAKTPASNYPDWSNFTTNTGAYTFKINDYADLSTIELFHDYEEGTDLEVHIHIATNGSDTTDRKAKYTVYYTLCNPDNGSYQFPEDQSLTAEVTIPANNLTRSAYYVAMGTIPGANLKIGCQIKFRIKRVSGTGIEPTGNPFVGMVGIHYRVNSLGSRTIINK